MGKDKVLKHYCRELVLDLGVRNESWIADHMDGAYDLFQGEPSIAASYLAALHPYALDYIKQCPALVVMAFSRGGYLSRTDRLNSARIWSSIMDKKPKLRNVLNAYSLTPPLRVLSGRSLCFTHTSAFLQLFAVKPSVVAQSISKAPNQDIWLTNLAGFCQYLLADVKILEWALKHLIPCVELNATAEACDYIVNNADTFNPKWSLQRVLKNTVEWHERIANLGSLDAAQQFFREHRVPWDMEIDCAPFPPKTILNGYHIEVLRSGKALFEEGTIMHHCIFSYAKSMLRGNKVYLSVKKDGLRIATVEVSGRDGRGGRSTFFSKAITLPRFEIIQARGICNSALDQNVISTLNAYLVNVENDLKRQQTTDS